MKVNLFIPAAFLIVSVHSPTCEIWIDILKDMFSLWITTFSGNLPKRSKNIVLIFWKRFLNTLMSTLLYFLSFFLILQTFGVTNISRPFVISTPLLISTHLFSLWMSKALDFPPYSLVRASNATYTHLCPPIAFHRSYCNYFNMVTETH